MSTARRNVAGQEYRVGDYVYVDTWWTQETQQLDPGLPHIAHIAGFSGKSTVDLEYFYRPGQTFHQRAQRFYPNEASSSRDRAKQPLTCLQGRCCVLSLADYCAYTPEGIEEQDVYICSMRYTAENRTFAQVKRGHISKRPVRKIARPSRVTPVQLRWEDVQRSLAEAKPDRAVRKIGGTVVQIVSDADIPVHIVNRVANPPAPVAVARSTRRPAREGKDGKAHAAFLAGRGSTNRGKQPASSGDAPIAGAHVLTDATPRSFLASSAAAEDTGDLQGPSGQEMYQLNQPATRKRKTPPAAPQAGSGGKKPRQREEEDPNEVRVPREAPALHGLGGVAMLILTPASVGCQPPPLPRPATAPPLPRHSPALLC